MKLSGVRVSMSFIVGLSTMATVIVALLFPPAAVVPDESFAFLLLPHAVASRPPAMRHVQAKRPRLLLNPTFIAVPPCRNGPTETHDARRPPGLVQLWF